ncbi:hypothetical protein [Cellulomonas fimi]|uniref:hypothetical protein n=1 Tax=Cellulomonas fimi TaxID=1708 RepID=UPI00235A138C|nr:hypothetical protein [Cellulomonas fimi]
MLGQSARGRRYVVIEIRCRSHGRIIASLDAAMRASESAWIDMSVRPATMRS